MQQYRRFGVPRVGVTAGDGTRAPSGVPPLVPQAAHRSRHGLDVSTVAVDEDQPLRPFARRAPELEKQLFEDGSTDRYGAGESLVLAAGPVGDRRSDDEGCAVPGTAESGDDGIGDCRGDAGVVVK